MNEPFVILVDENDNVAGTIKKMEAHKKALLHRAVSVFIINSKGEWILQKRALNKYHSNGLWTNTCCSHPYPGEECPEAATRRLREEMGLKCRLQEVFSFIYKEQMENGLTEHELDHVFVGVTDDMPIPDHNEVMDWRSIAYADLEHEISENPAKFTAWFRTIHSRVNECLKNLQDD